MKWISDCPEMPLRNAKHLIFFPSMCRGAFMTNTNPVVGTSR